MLKQEMQIFGWMLDSKLLKASPSGEVDANADGEGQREINSFDKSESEIFEFFNIFNIYCRKCEFIVDKGNILC